MATLPARYGEPFRELFFARIGEALTTPDMVLDVGAGRKPTIAPNRRPTRLQYVGLDESRSELESAGAGAYDSIVVADLATFLPEHAGLYDLVVSWQVLEHVRGLPDAVDNVHRYLRPGGRFLAMASGRWAIFAVANRVLPKAIAVPLVERLMGRTHDEIFPAVYEASDYEPLTRLLQNWHHHEVVPFWRAAEYFTRLPRLQAMYLFYEDRVARGDHRNLATHYLLDAHG